MRKILIPILFISFFGSCDSNTVFSETQSLPGYWNKDRKVEFAIPELDSSKKYNVYLHLRNTNDYKYNNLFLIVSMTFPNGKIVVDTLEYRMANPDGTWLGRGIGNVKENKLWYKENVSFFEKGSYRISVTHANRNNGDIDGVSNLEGIVDLGYSIEEAVRD